jgi:hypothetical protein
MFKNDTTPPSARDKTDSYQNSNVPNDNPIEAPITEVVEQVALMNIEETNQVPLSVKNGGNSQHGTETKTRNATEKSKTKARQVQDNGDDAKEKIDDERNIKKKRSNKNKRNRTIFHRMHRQTWGKKEGIRKQIKQAKKRRG